MATKKKLAASNSPLDRILGQYTQKHQVIKSAGLESLELLDFLVAASPHLRRPEHLSPVLSYFEAIEREPQFFCFSAPPRHGKSILTNHAVARLMLRKPGLKVAYGCYSLDLSRDFFSGEVKDILTANGFTIDRTKNSKEEWALENGSSFKAVAPGSGFTGRGADLIIIDDPYKDRAHAESGKIRDTTWNWVRDVAITRRSPRCSVVVTHTRWHHEDVIGVLARDHKKPFVNLQAITAPEHPPLVEHALWEDEWSLDRLLTDVKPILGEYGWSSLYMGNPIPRGGAVFGDPHFFSELDLQTLITEKKIVRYIIGIDCAYTEKTHSDYSAAVVIAVDVTGVAYILDVRRRQIKSPAFGEILKELRRTYHSPPIYWYVGGQEKVIAEYFRNSMGVPVKDVPAKEDKFVRAQAVAAAWNAGRVKIPSWSPPWMNDFINEILTFTGLDDPHDDQVDALAAAFIPQSRPKMPRGMAQNPVMPW